MIDGVEEDVSSVNELIRNILKPFVSWLITCWNSNLYYIYFWENIYLDIFCTLPGFSSLNRQNYVLVLKLNINKVLIRHKK